MHAMARLRWGGTSPTFRVLGLLPRHEAVLPCFWSLPGQFRSSMQVSWLPSGNGIITVYVAPSVEAVAMPLLPYNENLKEVSHLSTDSYDHLFGLRKAFDSTPTPYFSKLKLLSNNNKSQPTAWICLVDLMVQNETLRVTSLYCPRLARGRRGCATNQDQCHRCPHRYQSEEWGRSGEDGNQYHVCRRWPKMVGGRCPRILEPLLFRIAPPSRSHVLIRTVGTYTFRLWQSSRPSTNPTSCLTSR